MARIAIVKIRGPQDMEWHTPSMVRRGLKLVGAKEALLHLEKVSGQAFMPQLTLPYLAGLGLEYNRVHGRDHQFDVIDEPLEKLHLTGYDLVLFSANTPAALPSYRLSAQLRTQGVKTVIGGIHPSVLPEEAAPHADSVVIGEAEAIWEELLGDFERGELKPRYQGGRSCALSEIAKPAWHNAQVEDYCPWVIPVQTSRGCRNACTFCSTTRFQGVNRRHRPVQEIVDEIQWLKDEGILTPDKVVFFTDNNIVSDSDHRRGIRDTTYARSLFKALIPLEINWVGQGEIGVGNDTALVQLMAESGCFLLLIGLETISQSKLKQLGKRSNQVAEYVAALDNLHRHGIANIGCFITGLDEDGPEVFDDIAAFVDKYIDVPQISILTPYPGTVLYKQMEREGRLLHHNWEQYDITHVVFQPLRMSPSELEAGYLRLSEGIFSKRQMLKRSLRYALRPTVNGLPRFGFRERVGAILSTNLIYKRLSFQGRGLTLSPMRDQAYQCSRAKAARASA